MPQTVDEFLNPNSNKALSLFFAVFSCSSLTDGIYFSIFCLKSNFNYVEISTDKEESYEVWLAEELKAMNVDEESYERVFMKV